MSKSAYTKACEELKAKIEASAQPGRRSSCAFSRSDLTYLATAMLNCPEHVVQEYQMKTSGVDGSPITVEKMPARRYRESLKPILKEMGLDKNDVAKIDDIKFPKEHGAAVMDVAQQVIKDYMRAGRKFQFPITAEDEVRMEICCDEAPERINPNRFATTDAEKRRMTKTKKRCVIKAKNSAVPSWLKEVCDE